MSDKGVETLASGIVISPQERVLLIKSPKWKDGYTIPGGHIEEGEGILEAVTREVKEETGLDVVPEYCVSLGELVYDPDFHRKAHFIYIHIVCRALSEAVVKDETEVKQFIWVPPEEAKKLPLLKGIAPSIENYLQGVRMQITSHVTRPTNTMKQGRMRNT